jgi:hypothetical protein
MEGGRTYESLLDWPLPEHRAHMLAVCEQRRRGTPQLPPGGREHTEDLLQLHDGRIGADAVDGLQGPGVDGAFFEDLTVGAIGAVITRHGECWEGMSSVELGEVVGEGGQAVEPERTFGEVRPSAIGIRCGRADTSTEQLRQGEGRGEGGIEERKRQIGV